jgi:hypothetical protein
MTIRILGLLLLTAVVFSSCKKDKWDKEDKYEMSACEDDTYNDPNNYPTNVTQHIIEDLVYDQTCGCITDGYVKYVDNATNKTVALVKYDGAQKDGVCYGWGYKTLCEDGKCALGEEKKKDKEFDKKEWEDFLSAWAEKNGKGENFNQDELTKEEWTVIKKEWVEKYGEKKDKEDDDKDKYADKWCKFEQNCSRASDPSAN